MTVGAQTDFMNWSLFVWSVSIVSDYDYATYLTKYSIRYYLNIG